MTARCEWVILVEEARRRRRCWQPHASSGRGESWRLPKVKRIYNFSPSPTGHDCITPLSLKSLCGGGVPSSHPSLGLSVFFLSFWARLARTGTNTGTPRKSKNFRVPEFKKTPANDPLLKIPVSWRSAVLPSLPCVVCFLSFLAPRWSCILSFLQCWSSKELASSPRSSGATREFKIPRPFRPRVGYNPPFRRRSCRVCQTHGGAAPLHASVRPARRGRGL